MTTPYDWPVYGPQPVTGSNNAPPAPMLQGNPYGSGMNPGQMGPTPMGPYYSAPTLANSASGIVGGEPSMYEAPQIARPMSANAAADLANNARLAQGFPPLPAGVTAAMPVNPYGNTNATLPGAGAPGTASTGPGMTALQYAQQQLAAGPQGNIIPRGDHGQPSAWTSTNVNPDLVPGRQMSVYGSGPMGTNLSAHGFTPGTAAATPPGAIQGASPPGQGNPYIAGSGPTGGNQWGYGNRPGGGYGYYEQQTPLGSFAAANQQQAFNPYIGAQSQGIQGVGPIGAGSQPLNNPYLGQSTPQASAAANPLFGMNNPYTTQAIDAASQDAIRNYNTFTAPQRDAQMARSGSFGNTGVQQMQLEDQRNLQGTLGNIATGARMQDLAAQQQMGEAAATRGTSVNLANSGFGAGDLTRNMQGALSGYDLSNRYGLQSDMFNAGNQMQTQMFNANLGAGDLARNAGLAQGMGQFNAGQGNAMNMFNAGQGNQMLTQQRGLGEQARQFDQNFDLNAWQANMNAMRGGNQDQIALLNSLLGWQTLGMNAADQQQNTPLNQYLQFLQAGNVAGGAGGSASNPYFGNPVLGFLGGWGLGGQFGG